MDGVRGISSPTAAAAALPGKPSFEVIEVNFKGGGSGNLESKDHRSFVWEEVLDNIHHSNQAVYVEIDPQTNVITEVLVPMSVKVGIVTTLENADVEIELIVSHAKHYIRRSNPDFQKLSDALKKAKDEDKDVLVTEALNTHDIIDIKPNPNLMALAEVMRQAGE